jgi:hypothetical protein
MENYHHNIETIKQAFRDYFNLDPSSSDNASEFIRFYHDYTIARMLEANSPKSVKYRLEHVAMDMMLDGEGLFDEETMKDGFFYRVVNG